MFLSEMENQVFSVIVPNTIHDDKYMMKYYRVISPKRGCWVDVAAISMKFWRIEGEERILYDELIWEDVDPNYRNADGTVNKGWIEKGRVGIQRSTNLAVNGTPYIQLNAPYHYLLRPRPDE
jgi:hypothetical protein